jgi:hypothetical protein
MSTRSLNTTAGRFYFQADAAGVVWVHTKAHNYGGWRLDRFGTKLGAAWMRAWVAGVLSGVEVAA